MRRTLLSSLLAVCVLGKIIYNIIKGEICKCSIEGSPSNIRLDRVNFPDTSNSNLTYIDDYYEYEEEESYDNCSLASSLYYPLRRSETHYKRYK